MSGLTVLDPARGVYHPQDWAGSYVDGEKVDARVVWLTPEWEAAVAFALKGFVVDLVVDPKTDTIYLQSADPITDDMIGYVYVVDDSIPVETVNPWESYSRDPVPVLECIPVTIGSFRRYTPVVVERLPSNP